MPTSRTLCRVTILAVFLLLAACTEEPNLRLTPIAPPNPTDVAAQLMRVEVPVTVEVTRVFTQPVIIEATPSPPAACAQQHFATTGEIVVGSLLPLSQSSALSAGLAMQRALHLALAQIEQNPDWSAVSWRILTYDTAGLPDQAAAFAHRLITQDCAAVIIGGYHSTVALATADVAETHQIPYIVLHAAADELTREPHTVLRIAPTFSMYAQMPADLLNTLSARRATPLADALIVVDPITISPTLSQTILENIQASGIQAEILLVDLPTQNFSSTVARILSRPALPDIIFIQIRDNAALDLQAELLSAGIGPDHQVIIVNSQAARNPPAFWHTVPHGTGTIATHLGPWPGEISELGQAFAAAYSQFDQDWPPAYVFAAHDALLLFAHAFQQTESLDGPMLLEALRQSDITLAAGHYRFIADPDPPNPDAPNPDMPANSMAQQWLEPPLYYLRFTEPEQTLSAMQVEWRRQLAYPLTDNSGD